MQAGYAERDFQAWTTEKRKKEEECIRLPYIRGVFAWASCNRNAFQQKALFEKGGSPARDIILMTPSPHSQNQVHL
jgi:hypothetical protein